MKNRFASLLILFSTVLWLPGFANINASEAVLIGGIKQWISVKGISQKDPVLLFLHGGPGSSAMRFADRYTNELQKHFVVVQWDQRETGKTGQLNVSVQPLTVELFENDTFEMINYLRTRFLKEKIYLVGHSWGGFLGLSAAANHPELLEGYIAINPMVYQVESERASLKVMKARATAENDKQAILELSKVEIPFQNGEQLYYHRKWLALLMGQKPVSRAFVESWSVKWLALFNEASQVNFQSSAPEMKCPIYFFLGSKDYQTYFKITEHYYGILKADKKELFWFTQSAHLVPQTESRKLQETIIDHILPHS
jgi:pimeloyl-ACP methyl ester carboxylesterase